MANVSTLRLVLWPSLISLAVTLLRLVGELLHWSPAWFSTQTGGISPRGSSWIVGITWLAFPFGAWFGWRLAALGRGPSHIARALAVSIAGAAIAWFGVPLARHLPIAFPQWLVAVWAVMATAAALQFAGWPELFRTLLAYALASRIPVVVVMFLAMWHDWGTHYDYVGMPAPFQMPFWPRFLWLAFFPQLVFWVGFTIVAGSLAGSLAAAVRRSSAAANARPG